MTQKSRLGNSKSTGTTRDPNALYQQATNGQGLIVFLHRLKLTDHGTDDSLDDAVLDIEWVHGAVGGL